MANDYLFPTLNLPKSNDASYENIMNTLRTPTPTMSQFLPDLEKILSERSQFLEPAIGSLKRNIGEGMADLEGSFARRGLTGSSIEAQGLATAQGRGNEALGNLVGGFAREGSLTFAQLLQQARAGDVAAAQQLRQMIAQAMGEELTANRDMDMFNRSMDFQASQNSKNRTQQLINSLIQLGPMAIQAYGAKKAVGG